MAFRICDSTRPPSSMTREDSALSSVSNWVDRCLSAIRPPAGPPQGRPAPPRGAVNECELGGSFPVLLAEPAGDVVLGLLPLGLEEDLLGLADLHQVAQVHIGGVVGD